MYGRRKFVRAISISTALAIVPNQLTAAIAQGPPAATARADRRQTDLLPLIDVERASIRTPAPGGNSAVGGYVRIWIERSDLADPLTDDRLYRDERRNPLLRFFIGRSHARLLAARLVVNRANPINRTITLASAAHDSNNQQGENWSTELSERQFLTPYFRVDQGTTVSVEVSLSVSTRIQPDIARNVLSIIERGARLAAPTGPLVTALTSTQLNETASFVDTSISRLFGEALVERAQNDFPAENWGPGVTHMAVIRARFPMGRHIWTDAQSPYVGQWTLRVSAPIVSIFSPVLLDPPPDQGQAATCPTVADDKAGSATSSPLTGRDRQACLAFIGLDPGRVLDLKVGDNLTLGEALRADTGITAALQRFDGASNKTGAAEEICILVAQRAQGLVGLNAYDGAAALWAFASTGGIRPNIAGRIWDSECAPARLARRLGLRLSISSPTDGSSGNGSGGSGRTPANGNAADRPEQTEPTAETDQDE